MTANVPPDFSQRRASRQELVQTAAWDVAQPEPREEAVDGCRSGSAQASRTWRWARSPCATRRSRASSSGASARVVDPQLALLGEERRPPAGARPPARRSARRREAGRASGRRRRARPSRRRHGSGRAVPAAAEVPVVVSAGAGVVVGAHLAHPVRSRPAAPAVAARHGRARPARRAVERRPKPEPQERVVAGLAQAVRTELRPALEVAGPRGCHARPHHRQSKAARYGAASVERGPAPGRRDVDERLRVEDLRQQLDPVDHPRAGPAEVGGPVDGEHLSATDGLDRSRPPAAASVPTR